MGPRSSLEQFYRELSNVLDLKCQTLGQNPDDNKVGQFLGRTIQWHSWGISWRGDQKLVKELLEEWGMEGCSVVGTPCTREESGKPGEGGEKAIKELLSFF